MVFKEIITVYSENHIESINIKCKSYLMLKWLVNIATIRLWKVNHEKNAFTIKKNLLTSKNISLQTRKNLVKGYVWSIVLYKVMCG
jgi:hypothetical protein